jgi:putative endonuclease
MNNKETGKMGEDMAYKYLLINKYLILGRNYKEKFNEIDIIARDPLGILIFCEVKTINNSRGCNNGLSPEDNLSHAKYRKMVSASNIFLFRHPELSVADKGWQIDLIAVTLMGEKLFDLRHYKNI